MNSTDLQIPNNVTDLTLFKAEKVLKKYKEDFEKIDKNLILLQENINRLVSLKEMLGKAIFELENKVITDLINITKK